MARVLALLSAVGVMATAVAALIQRYGGRSPAPEADGPPLGKGPYTACVCKADTHFVERLADVTHQLRDSAIQEEWVVDWSRFNAHHDRAIAAAMAADYTDAVRQYCHAISLMMAELRHQRGR